MMLCKAETIGGREIIGRVVKIPMRLADDFYVIQTDKRYVEDNGSEKFEE
jgi:hypothetical protein